MFSQPIIVEPKELFKKKQGLSDIEIRGMYSLLDEILDEYLGEEDRPSVDHYFQLAYSDSQLNCCGEDFLPWAPEGLEEVPVSHFYLTENHLLMAVFFVGDEEKEVLVRIN